MSKPAPVRLHNPPKGRSNMANDTPSNHVSRRVLLRNAAAATVAGTALAQSRIYAEQPSKPKGRIKQSIVHWCFGARGEKWKLEKIELIEQMRADRAQFLSYLSLKKVQRLIHFYQNTENTNSSKT